MNNNNIDIDYIASLARLEIAPEQAEKLRHDLESIVGYIAELSEVDVSGVEPTAHAMASANVWREDVVVAPSEAQREAMFANAPALIDGDLIRLPQVLPGEGMN